MHFPLAAGGCQGAVDQALEMCDWGKSYKIYI